MAVGGVTADTLPLCCNSVDFNGMPPILQLVLLQADWLSRSASRITWFVAV